jgi:uncharacterized protein YgbK (DUF1537 family)
MKSNKKYAKVSEIFKTLPPQRPVDLKPLIKQERRKLNKTIVVLDDDPTGTQTVHDVYVLTDWNFDSIADEFRNKTELFYILTNSRSLTGSAANALAKEIGQNLMKASKRTGRDFLVVSRSDSTLRGHFPNEVNALAKSISYENAITFFIPAFFEGGRITLNDIHYVLENDRLVPASETPFAEDKTFGFINSDLKKYVAEKTKGIIPQEDVYSISIQELRSDDIDNIRGKIVSIPHGSVCIINAVSYQDLEVFTLAIYRSGRQIILRSAASIVPVLAGIDKKPLLDTEYFLQGSGGAVLSIIGSYVPKTTAQLESLKKVENAQFLELDINKILESAGEFHSLLAGIIDDILASGENLVLYTSRKLVADKDPEKSLLIGQKVSEFITELVRAIKSKPKAILTKGGITSSDIATRALGIKKALVVGQVAAGVPVWKLGEESKFPGINYVIFPGNVGNDDTLKEVFIKLTES